MWQTLAMLAPTLLGLLTGGGRDNSQTQTPGATNEDMTAILGNQRRRMELQDPLYEAVTRMAMGMLPTKYQSGNTALTSQRTGPTARRENLAIENAGRFPNAPNFGVQDPWATPNSLRTLRGTRENTEWAQR